MRDYFRALGMELVKLKGTVALAVVLSAPVLVVLLAFLQSLLHIFPMSSHSDSFGTSTWPSIAGQALSIWTVFLPLFVSLVTGLLADLEHRHHQWKHLFALPVSRGAILAAKQTSAVLLMLTSLMVLTVVSALTVELWRRFLVTVPQFPFGDWHVVTSQVVVAALWMVAVQTWVSLRWQSVLVGLGFGCFGVFLALLAKDETGPVRALPWLLPSNVINGLADGTSIDPWLWLGAAGGLLFSVLCGWDIVRRDVA
ncbi:MAG: ABC transporter permease [Acidobacteriota bacterium]